MLLYYLHLTLDARYSVCQHWGQMSLYALCVGFELSQLHFWFPLWNDEALVCPVKLFSFWLLFYFLPDVTHKCLWRLAQEGNHVLLWEHGRFTWKLIEPKLLIESAGAGTLTTEVNPIARFNSTVFYEPLTSCVCSFYASSGGYALSMGAGNPSVALKLLWMSGFSSIGSAGDMKVK